MSVSVSLGAQVDWMLLIELLIDIFFLSDIALNFNTGYISEQARRLPVAPPPPTHPVRHERRAAPHIRLEKVFSGSDKGADRCTARGQLQKAESMQVLVMERKAVAMHYLHTWFILDLIASIPLDLLLRGRRLDILRLPRLLKIIRMMQNKSFSQAGEALSLMIAEDSPLGSPDRLRALQDLVHIGRLTKDQV